MNIEKTIDALLDAAFRELQHDTGPNNPEWVHSMKILRKKFRAILGKNGSKPK